MCSLGCQVESACGENDNERPIFLFLFLILKNKKNVRSGSSEPVNFDLRECPEGWQNTMPDKFQNFTFDLTLLYITSLLLWVLLSGRVIIFSLLERVADNLVDYFMSIQGGTFARCFVFNVGF